MKLWKKIWFLLLLLSLQLTAIMLPRIARANTGLDGFNVLTLHFPSDASGVLSLAGSETLGKMKFSGGLALHGFGGLVEAGNPVNNQRAKLLDHVALGDFYAAMGVGDFLDVGFLLPVLFYADGMNINTQNHYSKTTLGDMAIEAKLRILRDKPRSVGIGFLSRLYVPTGDKKIFAGWNDPAWEMRLVADKTFGPFYLNTNVGYRIAARTTVRNITSGAAWNLYDDDRIVFGLGAAYALPLQKRSWKIMVALSGESVVDDFKKISTPVIVDAGIKKYFQNGLSLQVGGGRGLVDAVGSPSYHLFAALTFDGGWLHRERIKTNRANELARELREIVSFGFDDATLSEEGTKVVGAVADFMAEHYDTEALVEGYTDNLGARRYNDELGLRRAQNVADALKSRGIEGKRIDVISHGENDPLGDNATPAGRRENRRVDMTVR